jgi:pyrroloquinoline quinone biosynthesis protein B
VQIVVLGAAAGGGFPQWNCNCGNCRRARAAESAAPARTQSSLAVSGDGLRWVLLNASPDLRQQILATPRLHPTGGIRGSPIAGVVLTNGDVDHVAGLLSLREAQPLAIYAAQRVLDVLKSNPIFNVLSADCVARRAIAPEMPTALATQDGAPLGLAVMAFTVPGKLPLYLEDASAGPGLGTQAGDTIGLEISGTDGARFFYLPGCAAMPPELARRLEGARLVFFDGTLWRDDEMIATGAGTKTGKRMGHMSISGAHGTIAALSELGIGRKIFVHMNNTNPVLVSDSAEHAAAKAQGWEIAYDGMEVRL